MIATGRRDAWPLVAAACAALGGGALPAAALPARPAEAPPAAAPAPARGIAVSPPIRPALADSLPPAPRVALVATPADAASVAVLQRTLARLGASVVFVPLAPGDVVPASAPESFAPAGIRPARPVVAWRGELRFRAEARAPLDLAAPGTPGGPPGGGLALVRARLGADTRNAPHVRTSFRLQDAREMGIAGSPATPAATLEFHDAWVDLDSLLTPRLSLRLGRQGLEYGEGRLVSAPDWDNTGRAWDGARARWAGGRARLEGFFTGEGGGRRAGWRRLFWGADGTWRAGEGAELAAYRYVRAYGDASWTGERGTAGPLDDATSGARARFARGPLELRLEGAAQDGRRGGDRVRARYGAARLTARFASAWRTRLWVERCMASGDRDGADGVFGRFDPPARDAHAFQGALGVAGGSNLVDGCGGFTARPAPRWSVRGELHFFSLAEPRDAWVDGDGLVLRRDPTGAAGTSLGHEADGEVRWEVRPGVALGAGMSRFWRGSYVRATGGGPGAQWGYAQLDVGF